MDKGFFGDLFDFNHDGELDSMERAMDFITFKEMTSEEECDDDEFDDIEMSGLDYDEFSMMDEDERRMSLEYAGIDPDEYDFR